MSISLRWLRIWKAITSLIDIFAWLGKEQVPQIGLWPQDLVGIQALGGKALLGPSQTMGCPVTPSGGLCNTHSLYRPCQGDSNYTWALRAL